jgi:hypothetical protein
MMTNKRPFCKKCNKNVCAINYTKHGIVHYRSHCHRCGKKKIKGKLLPFKWEQAGYKKKSTCDCCGFKSIYTSQMTVYYVDGDLTNNMLSNLRSICLNCVEVVKRKNVNWKRGDLSVDY